MGEVILTMKDIDKSFVGVHALKNACLELKKGEVHALMDIDRNLQQGQRYHCV